MSDRSETNKEHLKKELRKLFKSMDFVSKNFLADEKVAEKDFQMYFNIYQQLGLAWEFLGQQCYINGLSVFNSPVVRYPRRS